MACVVNVNYMARQKTNQELSEITSTHPVLCPDGKYRWVYDVPMLKNPTILFEVYWALLVSIGIVWLIFVLLGSCSGELGLPLLWMSIKMFALLSAIFFVLGFVAYFFVAWYYGWKYSIMFIMDEKEVVHEQLKSTTHKARVIGKLTALGGAGGGIGMVGMGTLIATRTSMTTSLDDVRRLIPRRRMNCIKVNERFSRNRVFVADEDFDFVYDFLRQHCHNAR